MTGEFLREIAKVKKLLNEMTIKLDNTFNDKHIENKENINNTQDALCEVSVDINQRLSDIEDALCELSESEVE